MPDIYLTGKQENADEATELLRNALVAASGEPASQVVLTSADTADYESNPLEARYLTIERVLQDDEQIIIRPQQGLDIAIRTKPLKHQSKQQPSVQATHLAFVERYGDFVRVVNPYYFYEDTHKVSYRKYCFHVPGLASR